MGLAFLGYIEIYLFLKVCDKEWYSFGLLFGVSGIIIREILWQFLLKTR